MWGEAEGDGKGILVYFSQLFCDLKKKCGISVFVWKGKNRRRLPAGVLIHCHGQFLFYWAESLTEPHIRELQRG